MSQTTKSFLEYRKELEARVVEKAWADENFKQELMTDPHQALTQFGMNLPKELDIKVLEESPQVAYLVLPVSQEVLSDEQLDGLVGGADWTTISPDDLDSFGMKPSGGK